MTQIGAPGLSSVNVNFTKNLKSDKILTISLFLAKFRNQTT